MEGKTSVEPEVLGTLNPVFVYLFQLIKERTLMLPPPHVWSQVCVCLTHAHQLSLLRVDQNISKVIERNGRSHRAELEASKQRPCR